MQQRDPFEERKQMMDKLHSRRAKVLQHEAQGIQGADLGVAAQEDFEAGYSDIAGNADLYTVAKLMDGWQVNHAGDQRPPSDRYTQIGEHLRRVAKHPMMKEALQYGTTEDAAAFAIRTMPQDSAHTASGVVDKMIQQRQGGEWVEDRNPRYERPAE